VIVVQNFISSLLNSHLFDFHEGWIYVLGVGIAGGMAARARLRRSIAGSGLLYPSRTDIRFGCYGVRFVPTADLGMSSHLK
jgi:hypothetical protein